MQVAFGRVRRKSRIVADDTDCVDWGMEEREYVRVGNFCYKALSVV